MEKLKIKLGRACLILFTLSVSLSACKTEEYILPEEQGQKMSEIKKNKMEDHSSELPSITTLKNFMATRINANVNAITYDANTQQFIFRGVNQFSKADLAESYLHNGHKTNQK